MVVVVEKNETDEEEEEEKKKSSSYEGRAVDALGQKADEGRGKRRYAGGSCNHALIPGFPNGVTWHGLTPCRLLLNT